MCPPLQMLNICFLQGLQGLKTHESAIANRNKNQEMDLKCVDSQNYV